MHPSITKLANHFDDVLAAVAPGEQPESGPEFAARVTPPPPDIATCEPCGSPEEGAGEAMVLWWDDCAKEWYTSLPPPPDSEGDYYGSPAKAIISAPSPRKSRIPSPILTPKTANSRSTRSTNRRRKPAPPGSPPRATSRIRVR